MDKPIESFTSIGDKTFPAFGKKVTLPQKSQRQNVLNIYINDTSPPASAIYTLNPFYTFQALNSCVLRKVYFSLSARTLAGVNIPVPTIRLDITGTFGIQNSFIEIASAAEASKAQFLGFVSNTQFVDVNFDSGILLSANTSIVCSLFAQFSGALAVNDILFGQLTLVFEE